MQFAASLGMSDVVRAVAFALAKADSKSEDLDDAQEENSPRCCCRKYCNFIFFFTGAKICYHSSVKMHLAYLKIFMFPQIRNFDKMHIINIYLLKYSFKYI